MTMKQRAKKEPLAAIRLKCVADCTVGQPKEVELCPITDCFLWPFRFGMRPSTARKKGKNVGDCVPRSSRLLKKPTLSIG